MYRGICMGIALFDKKEQIGKTLFVFIRPDFKTKREFKTAVKRGVKIRVYPRRVEGVVDIVGATDQTFRSFWYPYAVANWYVKVHVEDGYVTKVYD